MKHLRLLTLILVVVLLAVVPFVAQADEHEEEEDLFPLVGELVFTEDGDIVFITVDDVPYILAPAGSFNPSEFMDYEEGTLFELDGILLNEGDDEDPGTIQVGSLEEYDEETDTDGDLVPDLEDNCPEEPNPIPDGEEEQLDTDMDGIGDECDEFPDVENDSDNDGVIDDDDICPDVYNPIEEGEDQVFPVDTDDDGVGDACEELEEDDEDDEEVDGEGGFYCRNRDIQHPAGGRLADQYEADYDELIAQFCGDDGDHKMGWGLIRRELRNNAELQGQGGSRRGNGNNGRGNGNNGRGNGNNGRGNGNNGRGNG